MGIHEKNKVFNIKVFIQRMSVYKAAVSSSGESTFDLHDVLLAEQAGVVKSNV